MHDYEYIQKMHKRYPKELKPETLDALVLELISRGMFVSSGSNQAVSNCLTRLKRHYLIYNKGTRSNPVWIKVDD